MSSSIYFTPIDRNKYVPTFRPSHVGDLLQSVFGNFPIDLDNESLATLRAWELSEPEENSWSALIKAIESHKLIRVWRE